jgi:tRNA guanosine-2'-O-methyltransferase
VHSDSLIRKRSSYLLKKAIQTSLDLSQPATTKYFQWKPEDSAKLQQVWDTFFLIYETLDEFTIHHISLLIYLLISISITFCIFDCLTVIKPVWTQLELLFNKIDFSWIEVLLKQGLLLHANTSVTKLLTLEFIQVCFCIFDKCVFRHVN